MKKKRSYTISKAKKVLQTEAEAIKELIPRLNKDFERIIEIILGCSGRIVVTGMGKPGIMGQKISATLSSTGTPSLFLHPAEAVHGDLGRVTKDDVVLALSNSGETEEILKLLPIIKKIGAKLVSFIGDKSSTLAKMSDFILDVSVKKEACPLGLVPTASTTAMLAMGDALAVALLERRGFRVEDFAFYHPAGTIGKKIWLKVEDVMRKDAANPLVRENSTIKEVLYKITKARAGSATIIDKNGRLLGIFTDGDLRRHLENDSHLPERKVKDVMTKNPVTIGPDRLAVEALRLLQQRKIDEVPVINENGKPIGLLDVQDLLKAGLV